MTTKRIIRSDNNRSRLPVKTLGIFASLLIVLAPSACSQNGPYMGGAETGALAGSALGAGLGAIIGNQSGHTGGGIAIGAAAGALSGAIIGAQADRQSSANYDQDDRIRRQEEELARQRREIDELRRSNPQDSFNYNDAPSRNDGGYGNPSYGSRY